MPLIAPAYMKLNVVLSILIPFSSELVKKWGAAQKNELDEGSKGGSENYYFMLLFEFCTFFASVEANMFVFFRSRNPFFKVLKNKTFCFLKTLVLRQIKPRGCF